MDLGKNIFKLHLAMITNPLKGIAHPKKIFNINLSSQLFFLYLSPGFPQNLPPPLLLKSPHHFV